MSVHARIGLAWLAAASALIHAIVVPEHLAEWALEGIFFVGTALAQVAWAAAVYRNPTRRVLLTGLAGNATLVSIWLYSRAIGIPIGPHTGELEAVGALDLFATLDEVASLLMLGLLVSGRTLRAGVAAAATTAMVGASVLSMAALSSGHSHGHIDAHMHAGAPH